MQSHDMHTEEIIVERSLIECLINQQGPIIPVGTTSLRTLESLYWMGELLSDLPDEAALPQPNQWTAYDRPGILSPQLALKRLLTWLDQRSANTLVGHTSLLIAPSYRFRMADALITNFHQPQSTLLLLVAAAIGDDWRKVYDFALANNYRFLSYGDSSLLWLSQNNKWTAPSQD